MSKKIQLSIAEPCHENWDNMNPVEKGRFCGSCQKQVVDFSTMNDRQVAAFFKKPSTGSLCGRFMQNQLDREIDIPRKRIPWVKYFFQFALPAFLVSMKATAQGKISVTKIEKSIATPTCNITVGKVVARIERPPVMGDTTVLKEVVLKPTISAIVNNKPGIDMISPNTLNPEPSIKIAETVKINSAIKANTRISTFPNAIVLGGAGILRKTSLVNGSIVKGKVVDENGIPIPFAYIEVIDKNQFVSSDSLGLFSIKINAGDDSVAVNVSSVGYQAKQQLVLNTTNLSNELIIQLEHDAKKLSEVVVVSYPVMGKLKRTMGSYSVCRKSTITSSIKELIMPAKDSVKVYPNPVKAGSSINVEWQKKETGKFMVQLLNQQGQLIFNREIWIDEEARLLDIAIPSIAAGNYFLVFTNKNTGKKFTTKVLVQ